ncbi:MAG: hypothetical protein ACLF0P_02870 [Thermoanaerobaculia bacterium]
MNRTMTEIARRRDRVATVLIVTLLAGAPTATAAPAGSPGTAVAERGPAASAGPGTSPAAAARDWLNERIDIALEDAAAPEFFRSMAEIADLEVAQIPELERTISMELHDVRVATALTAACESVGCLWRVEDGRLRILEDPESPVRGHEPKETVRSSGEVMTGESAPAGSAQALDERINIDLKDAKVSQVLRAFGEVAGARVEVDRALEGDLEMSIQVDDAPIRAALEMICQRHGCTWEWHETGEGPVLAFAAE